MQGRINTFQDKATAAVNTIVSLQPQRGSGNPGKDQRWRVLHISASYSTASAIGALQIADDKGNVFFDKDGNSFELGYEPLGFQVPRHEDATIQFGGSGAGVPGIFTVTLAAVAAVVGKVNIIYTLEF